MNRRLQMFAVIDDRTKRAKVTQQDGAGTLVCQCACPRRVILLSSA